MLHLIVIEFHFYKMKELQRRLVVKAAHYECINYTLENGWDDKFCVYFTTVKIN